MHIRLKNVFGKVKILIIKLNLFNNYSEDPFDIRQGIMSTRLYIVLLISGLFIFTIYTSQSTQTISKTMSLPSQAHYEILQQQYPNTLQCPCTVISIPYNEFVRITPVYHQLCGSDFVQSRWYESLLILEDTQIASNFFTYATSHFRALAMFCEIANITVAAANRQFLSTVFVTLGALQQSVFTLQMNALINTFLNSTRAEFLYALSLANEVLRANQYLSGFDKNMALIMLDVHAFQLTYAEPFLISSLSWYGHDENNKTCFCVSDPACQMSFDNPLGRFEPPGIFFGCFITDSALRSSLLCWYSEACLHELEQEFFSFGVSIATNISVLNATLPSRFPPTTLLQTIVNEIMTEQWNREISYDAFYQKCRPVSCSFTYTQRSDMIYVITTVMGLFGGLSVILRLISPVIVKLCLRRHNEGTSTNSSLSGEDRTILSHRVFFDSSSITSEYWFRQ